MEYRIWPNVTYIVNKNPVHTVWASLPGESSGCVARRFDSSRRQSRARRDPSSRVARGRRGKNYFAAIRRRERRSRTRGRRIGALTTTTNFFSLH